MLDRAAWYARPRAFERAGPVRPARVLAAALLLWVLLSGALYAQAPAPAVFVRLPAGLPAPAAYQLVSALKAQLADLAVVETSAGSVPPLLAVAIARVEDGLEIQFTDAAGGPLLAARPVAGELGELAASQVASIVRAFVVARLESAQVAAASSQGETGEPDAAAPEGEPTPATAAPRVASGAPIVHPVELLTRPPPPGTAAPIDRPALEARGSAREQSRAAPARWRLRLAVGYTGASYAPQLPWQSGVRVDVNAALSAWTYVGLSYGYLVPADVNGGEVTIRVSAHALGGFFGVGRTWRIFGVGADAVFGVTETVRRTLLTSQTLERTGDSARWTFLAALRLHGRVRFPGAPRLSLDLAPALEFASSSGDFVVDGTKSVVLSPRQVRARVDLGASFDIM
jgi:hypothetical protein